MTLTRLIALVALGAILHAQDAPDVTFRTSTQLVQVDVVVKAKDVPVTGLTKDDFEVLDNGKPQQIAVFSVREMGAANSPVQKLPDGVYSNRSIYRGPEPVTATIILFDSLNTQATDQGYVRLQALKYLAKAERNELIGLYQMDTTLRTLLPLTEDRDAIRKTVEKFNMVQSLSLQDGEDGLLAGLNDNSSTAAGLMNWQRRVDTTSAVLSALANHLKGLPGRKKLIWITSGLPPTATVQTQRNGVTMTDYYKLDDQLYPPANLLNAANVSVYTIDPRGPFVNMADPGLTTVIYFAQKTGGKAIYGNNDIAGDIGKVMTDTDLTYTLGFYSTEETRNAKQHSLKVNVKRSGVDVRYRQNYSDDGLSKPLTSQVRTGTLNTWMQEPLESTDIPIYASAAPTEKRPGFFDVAVRIDISGFKLQQKNDRFVGSFELAIAPDVTNNPKGLRQTVALNFTQEKLLDAMSNGVTVINRIRVSDAKGKLLSKRLHVVVMDNATVKAGSVRIPIAEGK